MHRIPKSAITMGIAVLAMFTSFLALGADNLSVSALAVATIFVCLWLYRKQVKREKLSALRDEESARSPPLG